MLAYASETGRRERKRAREKKRRKQRERKREEDRGRMGHSRRCYYLFDSGILRASWIYLDILVGTSAHGSMSFLSRAFIRPFRSSSTLIYTGRRGYFYITLGCSCARDLRTAVWVTNGG